MDKRRILVYGDSNVWGHDGSDFGRFETEHQWTTILQEKLGSSFSVIQDGLCGRISGDRDDYKPYRNGHSGFEIAIRSAAPIDIVCIALGVNDLKSRYQLTAAEIVSDLIWYDDFIKEFSQSEENCYHKITKIIYLSPGNIEENNYFHVPPGYVNDLENKLGGKGKIVVDPGELERGPDKLHYSIEDHKKVAQIMYEAIKEDV